MSDETIRRTKTLRKPSGKSVGEQQWHKGHKLPEITKPDIVEEGMPNYCTNCRGALDDAERELDYVTQVISIPELKQFIYQCLFQCAFTQGGIVLEVKKLYM